MKRELKKYYIHVSYLKRNEVKKLKAKWDPEAKLWYFTNPFAYNLFLDYAAEKPSKKDILEYCIVQANRIFKEKQKQKNQTTKKGNPISYCCVECGSQNVHKIEFRTDYSYTRNLEPVNSFTEPIENSDLPHYLYGHYCEICQSFVSIKEFSPALSKDFLRKEDIDLCDKLNNMLDSEISEDIFYLASLPDNFQKIENKVWEMLNDESLPYCQISYFSNLAKEYEPENENDLHAAELYNCDLIYMQAIAHVLGLEIPEDSGDFME